MLTAQPEDKYTQNNPTHYHLKSPTHNHPHTITLIITQTHSLTLTPTPVSQLHAPTLQQLAEVNSGLEQVISQRQSRRYGQHGGEHRDKPVLHHHL